MVFETHCMSCTCTELLLFNYVKINSVSNTRALLTYLIVINMFCFLRGQKELYHNCDNVICFILI